MNTPRKPVALTAEDHSRLEALAAHYKRTMGQQVSAMIDDAQALLARRTRYAERKPKRKGGR